MSWHWRNPKLRLRDRFRFRWKCGENSVSVQGSVLEWDEEGDAVVVRKAGRYTSEDIHRAIFPSGHLLRGR